MEIKTGELPEIAAHRAALGYGRGLPHVLEAARRRGTFSRRRRHRIRPPPSSPVLRAPHAVHPTPAFLTSQLGPPNPRRARPDTGSSRDRQIATAASRCRARRSRSARRYDVVAQELDTARQRCQPQDRLRLCRRSSSTTRTRARRVPRRRQPAGHAHLALAARHDLHPAGDAGRRRRLLRRSQAHRLVHPVRADPRRRRPGRHAARSRVEHREAQRLVVARAASRTTASCRCRTRSIRQSSAPSAASRRSIAGRDNADRRRPATARAQDLLFLHFAEATATVPACPAGWNVGLLSGGTTAGVTAIGLGETTCWKKAIATDPAPASSSPARVASRLPPSSCRTAASTRASSPRRRARRARSRQAAAAYNPGSNGASTYLPRPLRDHGDRQRGDRRVRRLRLGKHLDVAAGAT